jgi:hypothetical protein
MRALLVLILATSACVNTPAQGVETPTTAPSPVQRTGGEPQEVRVGASVPVAGSKTVITFERVSSDSRCPADAKCIWAGDAVVVLQVSGEGDGAATLELHANPRFAQQGEAHGVRVTLERLEPYPTTERPVSADTYVAHLRIASP